MLLHTVPKPVILLAELVLELMSEADLDEVLLMEYASHAHPWTRGNFLDSIAAGHWAYCILLPAPDDLHLLNITVNPSMRRQGLALRLMQAIESIASNLQIPRILLEVRPSNLAANALYTKMGFTELSIRKAYYPLESSTGQREDALVMSKPLNQSANLHEQ